MGTVLIIGVIAGILIFASQSGSPTPTLELGRPEGGKWREFDGVHLGRRGAYEYLVAYTPNAAQQFATMVRRAYGTELGPEEEYGPDTVIGGADDIMSAELAAIAHIDTLPVPSGFELFVQPLDPPLAAGEEVRQAFAGTDGIYSWEGYFVAAAPQPYVLNLGTDPERLVTIGTAPNETQAGEVLEEWITVHGRMPAPGS